MAKFYVQSGSLRGIVDCFDAQCAAVWAIQRALEKSGLQQWTDDSLDEEDGMFELDEEIFVNEQGFDRTDSVSIDLHQAFVYWYQLRKAIESLTRSWEERLGE